MQTAKVIPFQFKTTEVRTLEINDLIWFVASDVAKALEYPQAKDLARMLDEDERGRQIVPTPSGDQEVVIINESGLYHAILKSRKPEAQPFRKWVTAEVLPMIRKTGRYEPPATQLPAMITEAQAGELSALVAERFPDGRKRPYAWGRFNNHFRLSTYKTLPAQRFDEACDYIRNMPDKDQPATTQPGVPDLRFTRWQLIFDADGKQTMTQIPDGAHVLTIDRLIEILSGPDAPRDIGTHVLERLCCACVKMLSHRSNHYQFRFIQSQAPDGETRNLDVDEMFNELVQLSRNIQGEEQFAQWAAQLVEKMKGTIAERKKVKAG